MTKDKLSLLCLVAVSLIQSTLCQSPPVWPTEYYAEGVLELPYAEIREPFKAYYDGKMNRSRIDYYDEAVITMQIPVNSTVRNYKVTYMSNDTAKQYNLRKCFLVAENKTADYMPQAVLPNLNGFKYVGMDEKNKLDKWQMKEKVQNKLNTYTFWAKNKTVPVLYEMMGYDTLMGSHYDKYYLHYTNFTAMSFVNDTTTFVVKNLTCSGFPGPGDKEHRVTMNPMMEYINNNDEHTDEMFDRLQKTHNKKYSNVKEHAERKNIFRQNVRYIHSKNRASLGYTLKVNHLADLTVQELKKMRGYRPSGKSSNALPFDKTQFKVNKIPDMLDWRLFGAVTPVKDQAVCGSCWSFGTTGHIEGSFFVKTGDLVRLSQQELMDCSWGEGNNACDGGEDFRAYEWIMANGLATETDYGPYLGQNGMCKQMNVTPTVRIQGYHNITTGDLHDLQLALYAVGPISVSIDASHRSFSFYSNGVYYEPECGNTEDDLDHSVLAVGYGVMNGEAYWLIKNSWSTYWGNSGYVMMSQKNNNCGVATAATYVIM